MKFFFVNWTEIRTIWVVHLVNWDFNSLSSYYILYVCKALLNVHMHEKSAIEIGYNNNKSRERACANSPLCVALYAVCFFCSIQTYFFRSLLSTWWHEQFPLNSVGMSKYNPIFIVQTCRTPNPHNCNVCSGIRNPFTTGHALRINIKSKTTISI